MKKLLLLTFLSCIYLHANAQRILVTPYVLGLVDDFKGRNWSKDNFEENTLVDKFHSTEVILISFLDSLIKEENKRTYDKVFISNVKWEKEKCYFCQEFRRVLSKRLVEQMHEYYTFQKTNDQDENHHKVYNGVLKPKLFEKDHERYSFLAGTYARYGSREDALYSIKLISSKSKFDTVVRELKTLGCDIQKVDVKEGDSIVQQITFVPTPTLRIFLDLQERLHQDILKRKNKYYNDRKQEQKPSDLFTTT